MGDHAHHHHHEHPIEPSSPATTTILGSTATPPAAANLEFETTTIDAHLGHIGHDHGQQQQGVHEHQMKMFYHGGSEEIILFSFWRIDSFFGLFNAFIIIFLAGALYEAIKWFRVYFQLWTSDVSKLPGCVSMNKIAKGRRHQQEVENMLEKTAPTNISSSSCPGGCGDSSASNTLMMNQEVYAPTVVVTNTGAGMKINRWTWMMMYVSREFSPSTCRLIETTIYGIQLILAYWLMLITMTFNIWLTAAVVLGAAFGHWLFAGLKCAPPRRCYCSACCNGNGTVENMDNFASDACH